VAKKLTTLFKVYEMCGWGWGREWLKMSYEGGKGLAENVGIPAYRGV